MNDNKRREWVMPIGYIQDSVGTRTEYPRESYIKVRECLPGEITVTRADFRQVFARAFCAPQNSHKSFDPDMCFAMEAELWPEEGSRDEAT